MAQAVPDTTKEPIEGCLIEQDSFDQLVEQAWDPERIANPGDPVVIFTGVGTLDANLILDRWSDHHSYEYAFRTLVSQDAGTGWGYIVIPNIAGFQRPIITVEGTYRIQSGTVQDDDGVFGASPRGPFMGQEAHHWSSTQRIYMGYFRRDNAHRTYVDYRVKYICA